MLNRRELLSVGAATIASTMVSTETLASTTLGTDDKEAIDAHVHVWTPDTNAYPLAAGYRKETMVPPSFTPEQLFVHSQPNGVKKVVLIQMNFYEFDNRYMLDTIAKHPGVFAGVGIVDETRGNLAATMKTMYEQGVRGFRLYADKEKVALWNTSEAMRSFWKLAADLNQSMCLLANPDALPGALAFAKQFPKTRVVIDHFARIGIDGTIRDSDLSNLFAFSKLERAYVKASAYYALGLKRPPYEDLGDMIRKMIAEFGSKRLMWASDCPYQVGEGHTYKDSIDLIRSKLSFLTSEDRRNMLFNTAESVFFE